MRERVGRRSLLLGTLLAALLLPAAARQAAEFMGAITGTVRDTEGQGIADAVVSLEGSPHRTVTIADGRFFLDSVREGSYVIRVERVGYLPARAEVRVPKDSAIDLAITLQSSGQRLGAVRINERIRSRVVGRVLDEADQPLPGVTIDVVGLGRTLTSDSLGEFSFLDLPPGSYLLEARREGFERARYPLRMVNGLERDIALRLRRGERALTARDMFNSAMASREAESRQDLRVRTHTLIMGRDRLAAWGKAPLDIVLAQSELREMYLRTPRDQYCILIDGVRWLSRGLPTLVQPGDGNAPKTPPADDGWLRTFFADQVELVELYPPGTDVSMTTCGRFGTGSGCHCDPGQPTPPTVIVWMR